MCPRFRVQISKHTNIPLDLSVALSITVSIAIILMFTIQLPYKQRIFFCYQSFWVLTSGSRYGNSLIWQTKFFRWGQAIPAHLIQSSNYESSCTCTSTRIVGKTFPIDKSDPAWCRIDITILFDGGDHTSVVCSYGPNNTTFPTRRSYIMSVVISGNFWKHA